MTTTIFTILIVAFFFSYVLGRMHRLLEAIEENTREKK